MLKKDYTYISDVFNMIAYETDYGKIFNTRNEIIN